ncbi:MAG: hydro-lyase, Fe-S type, tartrate/fumarate subfamily [Clostridia bacterium]|uniref:fumarate hydratase n=3 Tax=Petroclostridium xylanilyticum TaxID=1792311 RepID=UPI000B982065|nr:fumarate hydratase [Petroclostridium xylanilyticum]MBZ4646200.1 hydro-lyase, Fe-S type, tartrate/fumarate subfamily [Clostridia bacterium]
MREINANQVIETVEKLCIDANYYLNEDIKYGIQNFMESEKSPVGKDILNKLIENAEIAKEQNMPICQDTGMAVIFVEAGQDAHIVGGSLTDAINEGVRRGYEKGYLRKSVVKDPLDRVNTGDNTPAVIHYDIVPGDKIKIIAAPKGFGSENMSAVKMLKPSDGVKGVIDFVIQTVDQAGANPCPPIVVGVGIGGTMEKAAYLAKKALLRPINQRSHNEYYGSLEQELLEKINRLGIGPQGLGGTTTALAVNIETFPTHIAGLPVAVNISCHVARHAEAVL